MPDPVNTPAAPAVDPVQSSGLTESAPAVETELVPQTEYTETQRAEWEKTGDLPRRPVAAKAEPKADPQPSREDWFIRTPKPAGVSNAQHATNEARRYAAEARERIAEREARIAEREARLDGREPAPRREPADPTNPQARQAPELPPDPNDPEPTIEQFAESADPYAAWIRAANAWDRRQERRVELHHERQRAQHTEMAQRFEGFLDRRVAYEADHPEFMEKAQPLLTEISAKNVEHVRQFGFNTPIFDTVMDSPVGPQMVEYFVDHLDDLNRIARLHPRTQLLELGKLSARFESASHPANDSALSAEPAAQPKPKYVSDAPEPPHTLGSRAAAPADEVVAALKSGNQSAYDKAQTQRELAAWRKGA